VTHHESTKSAAPVPAFEAWNLSGANYFTILQHDIQLIQIVDANLADAARRSGDHLVCRPGCTQCCYGAFAIGPLDALRLRTAMAELAQTEPAKAAEIAARARGYLAEFGPTFPGNQITGILSDSPEAQAAFEDFANDAPCPALNPENGMCDLYAARPMTCRVFGPPVRANSEPEKCEIAEEGFAICELCFTDATEDEIAAAEMTVPHVEEQEVLALLEAENLSASGDTIIAYCLDLPQPAQPGSS
jgi:Fe-S-cluster containining protein